LEGRQYARNPELLSLSHYASISEAGSNSSWVFTSFYGHPDRARRNKSWKLLSTIKNYTLGAWLCMGDFNENMDQTEKMGGALRNHAQMEKFRRVVHECKLGDLGFKGPKFTWSNKRESGVFVKERLDRALASPEWCTQHPNAVVEVIQVTNSDHKPLWLRQTSHFQRAPKLFRFEACWNVDEKCGTVIEQAWHRDMEGSNAVEDAKLKLEYCQQKLLE
jgi:hypothetical protein